ncbi:putative ribonuclease H-like domain-containing protein [Tanacetum coccineum]
MRPFGCLVTILNTLDHLGKFDGKADEGFFVGYSVNSKAFRVFNSRTRIVEETLHITFLENKPNVAGSDGPKWLFDIDVLTKSMNYVSDVAGTNSNDLVGTKESIGVGHSSKETGSSQDYILMPQWKYGSLFDYSSKNDSNDEPQPSSDAGKKDDVGVNKENGIDDQERPKNSTQDINTVGPSINTASTNVNTGSLNINIVSSTVTTAPLVATHADFFGDETEIDMSNINTTYLVPSTPNTRIHKDHSLDHVIDHVRSGVQTRRMTKTTNKQGLISAVYEGKTHKDLHTCLFACFQSQEESKKVIQELKDPSWIEAMQEEILQFKLQPVWTLVDLPYGKRAIGTKWVYRNKKDERVARIEAIMLFLPYASFKDFVVYQIDVKSAFLYGKTEEEVYFCQPLGFEDPKFPNKVYKVEKALYGLHQALELVQVYVDDIIFGSTKKELCTEFEKLMHKKFQMSSMGKLTFFLGLQVTQKDDRIFISQDKYVDEILKKFGFSTVKTASTPMETSKPLMPDIMFAVCACARFQVTPKVSHLYAVKRIFRYLKAQPKSGLWYPKDSPFDLKAYTNSDYAGASLDRKSTIGAANDEIQVSVVGLTYYYALMIQALVDGKKVIVTETSVRRGLLLKDDEGKRLSGRDTPLFPTMIVQAQEQEGEGSVMPTVPQHTPTINPPSTSKTQKKQSRRKQRKDNEVSQSSDPAEPMADETKNVESVPTHSNNPLLSGEDRLKLNKLMELCTSLS